jgi:hypothetical protein
MKYLIIFLLFPFISIAQEKTFVKKLLPMMCIPYSIFEEQQKRVNEKSVVFGIMDHSPDVLFELHKNESPDNPSFTVTLRRGTQICMIVAGTQLVPSWWFEEKGLGCEQ